MKLPPQRVRHLLIAPAYTLLATWLLLLASPLLVVFLLIAAFLLPISLRVPRLVGYVIIYMGLQVAGLWALLVLWVMSGFGRNLTTRRFEDLHYGLLKTLLQALMTAGTRLFHVTIAADGPILVGDDGNPLTEEFPLLVMSRHAGPGDSLFVLHEVMSWAGRRPRIVLKDTLQLDPFLDICFNRLPMRFIDPANPGEGASSIIAKLAETMGPPDALIIFPEGGNVTPGRRARAIEKLRESGLDEAAQRAEAMRHLMPPRPGGVSSALEAKPELIPVVVAHTGLDDLNTVADIWRELPQDKVLSLQWRAFEPGSPGETVSEVGDWLFDRWEELDRWVADRVDAPAGSQSAGPPSAGPPSPGPEAPEVG